MSIAVYSSNSEDDPFLDPFNTLIVNVLQSEWSGGGLLVFSRSKGPVPVTVDPGVRIALLSKRREGFLGRSLEKSRVLPRLLRKNKIRALILTDIKDTLRFPIPQFLLLQNAAGYTSKQLPALQKLAGIVVSSGLLKSMLVENTGLDPEKVLVVEGLLLPGLKPPEALAQLDFKNRVTAGREFFICADTQWSRKQLLTLLKAFSQFKKMQQSGWKLLLTQRGRHPGRAFSTVFDVLDTYKYREDVILFESSGAPDYAMALGAAYAAITFAQEDAFPAAAAEALTCQVPVVAAITGREPLHPDVFLFEAAQEASLAQRMMELYKNEGLRLQFIQRYEQHPLKLSPDAGLSLLKKRLLQA
ncbi:glycosyltransferase [Niabella hirudinis]|uniref:glycosyltransferase n=1 Tax=Niabella hirudinis TaxID=1285929 RepID=UPI003EBB66F6